MKQLSYAVHPALNIDCLTDQSTDHHTHNDAQSVRRADHAGDADTHGAQTQSKGDA